MKTVAAVMSAAIVVTAGAAFACGNSMRFRERDESMVAKASKAYREGNYAVAAELSKAALPGESTAAGRRALLRTNGLANLKLGNFAQSSSSFTLLAEENKEPFVRVKLAESQLRAAQASDSTDEAAKASLEKFASEGMLSDADAWAALARARAKSGDDAGARVACDEALTVQVGHPEATQVLTTLSVPKAKPSREPVKPSSKS